MKEKVSIIITVKNGEKWINECFQKIILQQFAFEENVILEVCVFDDCSSDKTVENLEKWKNRYFCDRGINMKIIKSEKSLGVGFGRNRAIECSSGDFLCFQDIDDLMTETRISSQIKLARKHKNAIIGSKFIRTPENSTIRFTNWANTLTAEQLTLQIYTSNGPTIIMPTWFFHKDVIKKIGKFSEKGAGTPEDLLFFYKHLSIGGEIYRVDETLLNYRYHLEATTFTIDKETIWKIRIKRLMENVLIKKPWSSGFTIWNAGKQGRKFYRDLSDDFKLNVRAFCDVDFGKLEKNYNYFDEIERKHKTTVPIIHFSKAIPPIIICVKLDLTHGNFENNLNILNLKEGKDYVLFS